MPVTAERPAPYAPASAILALVDRHRARGLPNYDSDVLARAGISSSLIPRTLQALQTLDLIFDDGKPTPILEGLRLAPEPEFRARLGEWLMKAYADALAYVDPAHDDEAKIRDAFRSYQPVGQQPRMVTLFIGLFSAAGIGPAKARENNARQSRASVAKKTVQFARKPQENKGEVPSKPTHPPIDTGLPPALAGLLASLPDAGNTWAEHERDRFLSTFKAVLDFCYPIARPQKAQIEREASEEGVE